ncbi:MAG: aminotransferase class III-fold pyridoxal phosphate-dependent enzyme [Alphaproteobacteria bacterium]|jgi:glutamate-1-semialdehyde 2,1-aminomutase|nr:aminotransferase class III-fold pyridoxal phosphate-dependent enzyme [Rhodospirillaceae bacterium]MDG2479887.1 aminotransferase class III-fold pyridoxal phosphate-dependent enzyme [Alphaproteobacteria bacterium]MBT6204111.1 aminotransferase class III-fold pyridoxal phosphate-dependent enzyme [Rhodospirillaceae bacterium]MBT6510611.1 aminotransferase class III-fold pyridoxal phosphate-dependent enzyme [Rhodospirillaceae bacterium]MBT7613847.1 aminotransferase class III-fold pyridoxal phosphat
MSNTGISKERIATLTQREVQTFALNNPKSRIASKDAGDLLLWGVPMVWQAGIEGPFSLFMESGRDNRVRDLDGHDYLDLSMGVYATLGHADPRYLTPLKESMENGLQHQYPSMILLDVARELNARLGNFRWNFSLNGTDANRWAIRLARHLTGRSKVLIPNYAYHGTVEEVQVLRGDDGTIDYYDSDVGTPPARAGDRTRIVEYNDLSTLEEELRHGDVAVVMMEPAMTNIGLVLPDPGYHDGVRALSRKYGSLLLIDETHTMWSGPAGLTGRWGLEPDIWTAGKIIGGGVPAGVYGFRDDLSRQLGETLRHSGEGLVGIGGTFSGGSHSLQGIHANLKYMLTPQNFARIEEMGSYATRGLQTVIDDLELPWHMGEQLGARVTYHFTPTPCRTMTDYVDKVHDDDLTYLLNLSMLNRGVMAMAFNNCWMVLPHCTPADIDLAVDAFRDSCQQLTVGT